MNIVEWFKKNRWILVTALMGLAGAGLLLPKLAISQSAIDIGVGQPPSVTVIFDSSASSQWTQEGFGTYPVMEASEATATDHHERTWEEGTQLNLPSSSVRRDGEWQTIDRKGELDGNHIDAIQSVGPCMVWHPMRGHEKQDQKKIPPGEAKGWDQLDHCGAYERPHMCGETDGCEDLGYMGDRYSDAMEERLGLMSDHANYRLSDDRNTPRHILIKQVLTGTMELGDSEEAEGQGPGCWFVPRGRGGAHEQVCCTEFDGNSCGDSDKSDAFEQFVDHRDPFPHIQEVYDRQLDNGLLDALGSTAVFSMAAFDSYPDGAYEGDELPMTDLMAGDEFPYSSGEFNHDVCCDGSQGQSVTAGSCDLPDWVVEDYCHQTGLFRMASAMNMMDASQNPTEVSRFVQRAILDAGFLRYEEEASEVETINQFFSAGMDFFDYPLGHQPVAQASPFGAAIHDLHQFYDGGQFLDYESSDSANPHNAEEDDYFACRARHAVLYTDGTSIGPEAPGGAGEELGTEFIDDNFGAFGYLEQLFPYLPAEDAISEMITFVKDEMNAALDDGEEIDEIHYPRVHVLASGIEGEALVDGDDDSDAQAQRRRVLEKLAEMAVSGDTCAQYYMPPEYLPSGMENGNGEGGDCDPSAGDSCLVDQGRNWSYYPPGEEESFACDAPALVLSDEDRDVVHDAFLAVFNEIAGMSGAGAPTRPAISNFTDDTADQVGQFRFFSGFEQSGDSPHWRGLINRQFLQCDQQGEIDPQSFDEVLDIHREIDLLRASVGDEPPARDETPLANDRRRVFTSFPSIVTGRNPSMSDGFGLVPAGGGEDAIQPDNPLGDSEGYRVPFEYSYFSDTFDDDNQLDEDRLYSYFNVSDFEEFRRIIDHLRGRHPTKHDRVLGGIRFSNPVAVGPPSLDLPINSYREFRQQQSNRPTMLYVSTLDGQLRAIHGGRSEQEVAVQSPNMESPDDVVASGVDDTGYAEEQREAWAYIPALVHNRLGLFGDFTAPDSLMDGSPVVEDVRLCPRGGILGPNRICAGAGGEEWRTVLVQGMGLAGQGYFALDVTRSGVSAGGEVTLPEPLVLWEFGPEWEAAQMQEMNSSRYADGAMEAFGDEDLDGSGGACDTTNLPDGCSYFPGERSGSSGALCDGDNYDHPWDLPFMASTVGEPAIGTVSLDRSGAQGPVQTPVAVVGAGTSDNARLNMPYSSEELSGCGQELLGRAIYVINLATGEMLRRFVTYDDDGSGESRFGGDITGTPVLSGSDPGDLSTRAFIGDEDGKMFRIDLSSSDPTDWDVGLFFDPVEEGMISDLEGDETMGPAAYKPTVTQSPMGELILIYGLGDQGETWDSNSVQAMLAVRESIEDGEPRGEGLWAEEFDDREHLTGAPVLFNFNVYFTTYLEQENQCLAGFSRIYNLSVTGDGEGGVQGGWNPGSEWPQQTFRVENDDEPAKWIQPRQPTLIRGMALTLGPVCEADGGEGLGQSSNPQLVAQTGVDIAGDDIGDDGQFDGGDQGGRVGDVGGIGEISIDLERPTSRGMPMSWSVLQR